MRVASTRKTKGRSPHIPPASSRRHTPFNFEVISRSYLSPLISTEMIFWPLFFVFVSTYSAADTFADWPDADEEKALKKDIAMDQLTIDDYSRFHSQGRKWVKPDISPDGEFRIQEAAVSSEDLAISDDGLTYNRGKRDVEEDVLYSGGNPCDDSIPPCRGVGQTCVFNTSSPDNYHCECRKDGFEEITIAPNLTCAAVSAKNLALVVGLSVGTPLFVIITMIIVFLVYRLVKRRKAISRKTFSDNESNTSSIFSRLPIFGMQGIQGMYKPHNFSETSEEVKNYDRGYSEISPWTSRRIKESRGLDTEEPTSFSWDRFCQTSVPQEEFHIKRPQISVSANRVY